MCSAKKKKLVVKSKVVVQEAQYTNKKSQKVIAKVTPSSRSGKGFVAFFMCVSTGEEHDARKRKRILLGCLCRAGVRLLRLQGKSHRHFYERVLRTPFCRLEAQRP